MSRRVHIDNVECEQTAVFAAEFTGPSLHLDRVVLPDGARAAQESHDKGDERK